MSLQSVIEVHRDGKIVDTLSFTQGLIRIGRTSQAKDGPIDVVLASERVSGLHAQIVVGEAGMTLVDRSRNGTFVNGELVQSPRPLRPEDRVEIDVFTLRCDRGGPVEVPSKPTPTARSVESPTLEITGDDLELDLVPEDDELPIFDIGSEEAESPPPNATRGSEVAFTLASREGPHPRDVVDTAPSVLVPDIPPSLDDEQRASPASERRRLEVTSQPQNALAELYRHLASRFGAAWGQPPRLEPISLPRTLEAARQAIEARGALSDSALWTEWLARELCGVDPIQSLLEDATVTGVDVHGDHGITVHRGAAREAAVVRFSCVESIHAAIERWTGRRLDGPPLEHDAGGLTLRAFDRALVPNGPLVIVRRVASSGRSLTDLVEGQVLPDAAAEIVRACLAHGDGILVHGSSQIDPTELLTALRGELPPERIVAVIQRLSTWSPAQALAIDGHQDPDEVWRCAQRLGPEWLIIEELRGADLVHLCDVGRHRGGGTIAAVQARSGEAALARLSGLMAASTRGDVAACRAAVASTFDLVLGLRERKSGGSQVYSLAELRARGELAELYTWRSATSSLEATGIDSQLYT